METISPVYARLLLRELERREIDPAPLFAGIALSRLELERGGDISVVDFRHILQTADRLLGDEQLGFLLGRKVHVFAMGAVGAAIAVAPSLRDGLRVLESYTRLHASYIDVSVRSTMQGLTATISYGHETGHVERFHTETGMLLVQQYIETLAGQPVTDARYRFALPGPEDRELYSGVFHGSISFGADFNEVDIPQGVLDQPSPYYHSELWHQARMSLSQSLKTRSESEGKAYTQHIAAMFRSSEPPLPDLGAVASDLNVSQRTLNRRLRAENSSFRQVKRQALVERAKLYLRNTDYSVEAIAEQLGYTDAANFRRAFRNSEGCSPIEFRQNSPSSSI